MKISFSILLACIVLTTTVAAQTTYYRNAFIVNGDYSKHGSGDLKGIVFGAGYLRYYKPKISVYYNFQGSINYGIDKIITIDNVDGIVTDGSVRYTTAGVQAGAIALLSFIQTKKHEVSIGLGPFLRFQSASNGSDGYSIFYPNTTGVPLALIAYDNKTPQNTYSVGGMLQLQYRYTFKNGILIGFGPSIQTDSNGDLIIQAGLQVGKRL